MPNPPGPPANLEQSLNTISHILQCAAATAYETGDQLKGSDRDLAFSVMHLVELAKTRMDEVLRGLSTEAVIH
jgi:hypothetical protein